MKSPLFLSFALVIVSLPLAAISIISITKFEDTPRHADKSEFQACKCLDNADAACCQTTSKAPESLASVGECCGSNIEAIQERKDAEEFMLMMQGMAGNGPDNSKWIASKLFQGFIAAPMPCCGEPGSKEAGAEHSCCDRQKESLAKAETANDKQKAFVHFESQFGGASAHASHFSDLLKKGIAPSKKYALPPIPSVVRSSNKVTDGKLSYAEWVQEYARAGTVPLPGEYERYLASGNLEEVKSNNAELIESTDGIKDEIERIEVKVVPLSIDSASDPTHSHQSENDNGIEIEKEGSKHFSVSATNVDMVYNRFGGHDPLAMVYALDENVSATLAGSGLFNGGHDPLFFGCGQHEHLKVRNPITGEEYKEDVLTIEPLVIRANLGDKIVIDLTNRLHEALPAQKCGAGSVQGLLESEFWNKKELASLPVFLKSDTAGDPLEGETKNDKISLHIRGASYKDPDDAGLVGLNGVNGKSGRVRYEITIPKSKSALGTYYFHSRPLTTGASQPSPRTEERDDKQKPNEIENMVAQVTHGLIGALIIEPKGSRYFDNEQFEIDDPKDPIEFKVVEGSYKEIKSGWGAIIVPGDGTEPFREYSLFFHDNLLDKIDGLVERDPRAINYRTEPFSDIFSPGVEGTRPRTLGAQPFAVNDRSMAYSAYTYGDSSTPHPRFYVGDRMCYRVIHAGMGDQFHVFHHHAHRWRFQSRVSEDGNEDNLPNETKTSKFGRGTSGLGLGQPGVELTNSTRIDSQTLGPAETFDVFMEGGAGGVQRTVGDVLIHCHIINHVTQGMWTYCRIHNTLQLPTDHNKRKVENEETVKVIAPTVPGLAPIPKRVSSVDEPIVANENLKPPIAVEYSKFLKSRALKDLAKKIQPAEGALSRLIDKNDDAKRFQNKEVDLLSALVESQLPTRGVPVVDEKADAKDVQRINRSDVWDWTVESEPAPSRGDTRINKQPDPFPIENEIIYSILKEYDSNVFTLPDAIGSGRQIVILPEADFIGFKFSIKDVVENDEVEDVLLFNGRREKSFDVQLKKSASVWKLVDLDKETWGLVQLPHLNVPREYLGELYDRSGSGSVHFGVGFPTTGEGIGARPQFIEMESNWAINDTERPTLKFNPVDARLAYPHLVPQAGKRPPFAPKKRLVVQVERQDIEGKTTFSRLIDKFYDGRADYAKIVFDPTTQGTPFLGTSVGSEGGDPLVGDPLVGLPTGSGLVPLERDRQHSRGIEIVRKMLTEELPLGEEVKFTDYEIAFKQDEDPGPVTGDFNLPQATANDVKSQITFNVLAGSKLELQPFGDDKIFKSDGFEMGDALAQGLYALSITAEGKWLLVTNGTNRPAVTPRSTVRHYDIVALTLPINYTTHNGYHISNTAFGTSAIESPPLKSWAVEVRGQGVAWSGQYVEDKDSAHPKPVRDPLQNAIFVVPGQEIRWTIPSAGQNHGVVFLDGAVARKLFKTEGLSKLIPQPRFSGDGDDPIGVDQQSGPRTFKNPILKLAIREDLLPSEYESIDFVCNVHGVVMKGSLVFEPVDPNVDKNGQIFVLRDDIPDVMAGRKPAEPIVIRGNVGDVIDITLTSALVDNKQNRGYSKVGIHTHLVQYDVQGSDGAVAGLNYETSVRPALKWNKETESLEPIPDGIKYGEQVHYRWWCDVDLGTVYFHDHSLLKDSLPHGLFGATIVEPHGSKYLDPETGDELYVRNLGKYSSTSTRNGVTVADIEIPGTRDGTPNDFREFVPLFNDVRDSINLRRESLLTYRMGDPFGNLLLLDRSKTAINARKKQIEWGFSSRVHGDPVTDTWRAYSNDPFHVRTEGAGTHEIHSLRVDGHRWKFERNYENSNLRDFGIVGVSEAFTFKSDAGSAGDYLYGGTGELDLVDNGKWGLLRVLNESLENVQGKIGAPNHLAIVVDRPTTITIPKNHLFVAANGEHFVTTKRTFVRMSRGEVKTDLPAGYNEDVDLLEFHKFNLPDLMKRNEKDGKNEDMDVWVFGVEVQPVNASDLANVPANTPFATSFKGMTVLPEDPNEILIEAADLSDESIRQMCSSILNVEQGFPKHIRDTFVVDSDVREIIRRLAGDQTQQPIAEDKSEFLKFLNEKLGTSNELYSRDALAGVALPGLLQRLAGSRNSLQPDELRLMNRMLLEVAFPGSIPALLREPRIIGIRSVKPFIDGKTPLQPLSDKVSLSPKIITPPTEFYLVATDVSVPVGYNGIPVVGTTVGSGNEISNVWKQGVRLSTLNPNAPENNPESALLVFAKGGDKEIPFSVVSPDPNNLMSHGISIRGVSKDLVRNVRPDGQHNPEAPIELLPLGSFVFEEDPETKEKRWNNKDNSSNGSLGSIKLHKSLDSPFFVTCAVHHENMQVVILSELTFLAYIPVPKELFDDLSQLAQEKNGYKKSTKVLDKFLEDEHYLENPQPAILRAQKADTGDTRVEMHLLNLLPESNDSGGQIPFEDKLKTSKWRGVTSINPGNANVEPNHQGAAVGENLPSNVEHLKFHTYEWTIPDGVSTCFFTDRADPRHQLLGLFGALIVEPAEFEVEDNKYAANVKQGNSSPPFKEFVIFVHDNWLLEGFGINYGNANQELSTPDLISKAGENVVVRVIQSAGKGGFDNHSFFVGERRWPFDFHMDAAKRNPSNGISAITTVPGAAFDLWLGKNPEVKERSVSFYGSGVGTHLKGGEWGKFIVEEK